MPWAGLGAAGCPAGPRAPRKDPARPHCLTGAQGGLAGVPLGLAGSPRGEEAFSAELGHDAKSLEFTCHGPAWAPRGARRGPGPPARIPGALTGTQRGLAGIPVGPAGSPRSEEVFSAELGHDAKSLGLTCPGPAWAPWGARRGPGAPARIPRALTGAQGGLTGVPLGPARSPRSEEVFSAELGHDAKSLEFTCPGPAWRRGVPGGQGLKIIWKII